MGRRWQALQPELDECMAAGYPEQIVNTSSLRKVGQMKNEIGFRPACENFLYMILFISNGGGW